MPEMEFSISDTLAAFLNRYGEYGFTDQSAMVEAALLRLRNELEPRDLNESAQLYAEVYAADAELRGLTESTIVGWPD